MSVTDGVCSNCHKWHGLEDCEVKKPRRFRSETFALTLPGGNGSTHNFDVSLAYTEEGVLNDVIFVGRGKIGHGLDLMFNELGIQLSRLVQGRDPEVSE